VCGCRRVDHNRYYVEAKDEFGFAPETIPPLQAYIEGRTSSRRRRAFQGRRENRDGAPTRVYSMFGQNHARAWLVHQGRDDPGGRRWRRQRRFRPRCSVTPGDSGRQSAQATSPTSWRWTAIRSRDVDVVINKVPLGDEGAARWSWTAQGPRQRRSKHSSSGFLLNLGDHQVDKVAADLAPKALVVIARERPPSTGFRPPRCGPAGEQTGDEWIASMRSNSSPVTFREPLTNVTVDDRQRSPSRNVRADFQIMRDGQGPSRTGRRSVSRLVRESSGWKFAVIAYTSMADR